MIQKGQLEKILKLKENITPLPWKTGICKDGVYADKSCLIREDPLASGSRGLGREIMGVRQLGYPQVGNVEENAAYVVEVCNLFPELANAYLKLLKIAEKLTNTAVSTGYYSTADRHDHVFYEVDKQILEELKQFLVDQTLVIDILNAPASRYLDKLVAQFVFGMTDESIEEGARQVFYNMRDRSRGAGMIGNEEYEKDCAEWRKEKFRDMQIPHYSTNIADAFTVVKTMEDKHNYVYRMGFIEVEHNTWQRSVEFFKPGEHGGYPVAGYPESLAICRAAVYTMIFANKEGN